MIAYQIDNLFESLRTGDVIAWCWNDEGVWGGDFLDKMLKWSKKRMHYAYEHLRLTCGQWNKGELSDVPKFEFGETFFQRLWFESGHARMLANYTEYDECNKRMPVEYYYIATMVGKHFDLTEANSPRICHSLLGSAMQKVVDYAGRPISRILVPQFDAGSEWEKVEKLIKEVWKDQNVIVFRSL
jgi:hypothetical protein